jgi:hypothetical protein
MSDPAASSTVEIRYETSGCYQSHSIEGALVSTTPSRNVLISFYIERQAFPEAAKYEIQPDGSLGELLSQDLGPDVVRELCCGIVVDRAGLRSLKTLIDKAIEMEKEGGPSDAS